MEWHNTYSDSEDDFAGVLDLVPVQGESEAQKAQRYAILRQIRTQEGQKEFVDSVINHSVLASECDWGALLSSAPRALSHMGQCFVVASTPLAASLRFPDAALWKLE
jgi:hypothetical protein